LFKKSFCCLLVGSLSSSSVYIADQIKELDMSMPSYDDIKSSKASVENVKSLSVPLKTTTEESSSSIAALQKKKSPSPTNSNVPSVKKSSKEKKKLSNSNLGSQGYEF
jgi:hypothetical protein